MSTGHLFNPGPVVTPASNPHRVGAPNHLKGSGENPMVGVRKTLITNDMVPVFGTAAYGTAVRATMFRATLLGGIPKQGKTAGWRVLLASGAELDVATREAGGRR